MSEESVNQLLFPVKKQLSIGITILTPFHHSDVAALIHEAKFHNNRRAVYLLGTLLHTYLSEQCPFNIDVIVPIPLSAARMRTRGYNQVLEVVRVAQSSQTDVIAPKALTRIRDTAPQTVLARAERLDNMQDAFRITATGASLAGKQVLLIDDVATTGATMVAARAALLQAKPTRIHCLALAG